MLKPQGWSKFDKLARAIVAVPKETVDAKIASDKLARKKCRKPNGTITLYAYRTKKII